MEVNTLLREEDCGGEVNTLCRICWGIVDHKCDCPKEAIVRCKCEAPKPFPNFAALTKQARELKEADMGTWEQINARVDALEKLVSDEEPNLEGAVLDAE